MTDIDTLEKKISNDQSLLEYITSFIPIYRGYQEKDLRREADAVIRDQLHTTLHKAIHDLRWSHKELINADLCIQGTQIEDVIIQTDLISKKILHAKQGNSSIWKGISVKSTELSELMRFDACLLEQSKALGTLTVKMTHEIKKKNFEEIDQVINQYNQVLAKFNQLYLRRDEVILGLSTIGDQSW